MACWIWAFERPEHSRKLCVFAPLTLAANRPPMSLHRLFWSIAAVFVSLISSRSDAAPQRYLFLDPALLEKSDHIVIAAHVNWWNVPEGPFYHLADLQEGDRIELTGDDGKVYVRNYGLGFLIVIY